MKEIGIVVLLFGIFGYFYYAFKLVDTILGEARGEKWHRILLCILEVGLIIGLITFSKSTSVLAYITIWGILLINFTMCYKTSFIKAFFCAAACVMHVMALRSITAACFTIVMKKNIFFIANDPVVLMLNIIVMVGLLCAAIFLVIKFIPVKYIRIITQYPEPLWFMSSWMILFNIYFLMNAKVYNTTDVHRDLLANQLIAPIIILTGLYMILFYTMKTVKLLGYKEKNERLENEVANERQYRNRVMKDILKDYEFNFSKNQVLKGHEEYVEQYGAFIKNYNDMQSIFIKRIVHSEDTKELLRYDNCEKVMAAFRSGVREHVEDYRRITLEGTYRWVRAVTAMWEEENTHDIKGYVYIRDIHDEKKRQLELQRKAERDSLTGLFNKGVTEKRIVEYVEQKEDGNSGVLFIVDVDNFKAINDYIGHTFGDVVLCELADKLKVIFRKNDIVGRIGGDEFMVFVSDMISQKDMEEKASQIIKLFANSYEGADKKNHQISASVGAAIYPNDGVSFKELYQNADAALYLAKNAGKNRYHFFKKEKFKPYEGNRTKFNENAKKNQKNFQENRLEYIFKILYDAGSYFEAMNNVLAVIARQFLFDRGYIFETNEKEDTVSNTYEWCAQGISSEKDNLQKMKVEIMQDAVAAFKTEGIFRLRSVEELNSKGAKDCLQQQQIKSMVQFAVYDNDKWLGFIGFDDCKRERELSATELEELSTLSNIIATFIVKQKNIRQLENTQFFLTSVLNSLDSYTYVIRKGTKEILFMNEKTIKIVGENRDKLPCHLALRGEEHTCKDCPISKLSEDMNASISAEIYNAKYQFWMETTVSNIQWLDGEPAYLVNCEDITKYKEMSK